MFVLILYSFIITIHVPKCKSFFPFPTFDDMAASNMIAFDNFEKMAVSPFDTEKLP